MREWLFKLSRAMGRLNFKLTWGEQAMASSTIQPLLMFQGKADEAMTFYVSLFPGAEVHSPGESQRVLCARCPVAQLTSHLCS
jgi:hypothetical protein